MDTQTHIRHRIWAFLRPELEEITVYIVVIVSLLGFALYQVLNQTDNLSSASDLAPLFSSALDATQSYINNSESWARFFLFGFWFIVGGVAYALVWSAVTLYIDLHNDIEVSESFMHPRSFSKSDYWLSIGARVLLRGVAAITLVVYAIYWLWVLAPVSVQNMANALLQPFSASSILSIVGTCAVLLITVHIGSILLRLTLLRPTEPEEA